MQTRSTTIQIVGAIALSCSVCLAALEAIAMTQTERAGWSMEQNQVSSSDIDYGWRKTRFGWQDSTLWSVDTYSPPLKVELVHPLVWAALVLIAVIGATIWATEEWELNRLLNPRCRFGEMGRRWMSHEKEKS